MGSLPGQGSLFSTESTPKFVRGSETSRSAAESIQPAAQSLRSQVLACVVDAGDAGRTCDEIEALLSGRHQTISARVRELSQRGFIKRNGNVRKTRSGRNAAVYVEA